MNSTGLFAWPSNSKKAEAANRILKIPTGDGMALVEPDLRKAIELLDEAVKRDPSFFDAYCQLAWTHEQLYAVFGSDHTPARLALAEAALQAAARLRPDAAETHLARAQYLYYGLRDYAGALAELEIARRSNWKLDCVLAPNASQMLSYGALKLFPVWYPLRGDLRFEKIVASLAPKQ